MTDLLSPLTRDGRRVLANAKRIAKKHRQNIIASEHLLMGLLQLSGSQGELVLEKLLDLDNLKARLGAYIKLQAKEDQSGVEVGYADRRMKLSVDSKDI